MAPIRRRAIILASAAGVALGMALGVLLGDRTDSAARKGVGIERLAIPGLSPAAASSVHAPPVLAERPVRNVVLLIGDGMGLTQIAAGRILTRGIAGRLHLECFPTVGLVTTHPAAAVVTRSD
ncbi:MAG: alkaline phosphatase, partial [Thermoanaerobaculia bacterium]